MGPECGCRVVAWCEKPLCLRGVANTVAVDGANRNVGFAVRFGGVVAADKVGRTKSGDLVRPT